MNAEVAETGDSEGCRQLIWYMTLQCKYSRWYSLHSHLVFKPELIHSTGNRGCLTHLQDAIHFSTSWPIPQDTSVWLSVTFSYTLNGQYYELLGAVSPPLSWQYNDSPWSQRLNGCFGLQFEPGHRHSVLKKAYFVTLADSDS